MKRWQLNLTWQTFLLALFFSLTASAQTLDLIGVTALRANTTNLDGRGIRVAQPEANLNGGVPPSAFEVNPAAVGRSVSYFSYYSAAGSATNYPNAVGTESGHANGVAQNFYGSSGGVATNVAHIDSYDADFYLTNYVFNLTPAPAATVVNQSFTFGLLTNSDQQAVDSSYDDYAQTFGTFFIAAAGNASPTIFRVAAPGTAYNCISVGAYGGGSNIGPTLDNGRCKPDITAPAGDTSSSTPLVAGAAAVLLQAALRGDGGADTNSAFDQRTIKALLLNGAVKPADWTNSRAMPLDARYGAGLLNVLNAYQQLAGGKRGYVVSATVSVGAPHPPTGATGTVSVLSGWDFNTNTSSVLNDRVSHYYFNVSNNVAGQKFLATATLVWSRQYNKSAINDLNLFLYNCANSNLVLCSTSLVDNVEHLYVTNLPAGRYDLQVLKRGGFGTASSSEAYALAWEFVAPPVLTLGAGSNSSLAWPVYPAGFLVEARTNLLVGAWQTNGLPAVSFTNGQSNIRLNPTNAAQFFRLRRPNF